MRLVIIKSTKIWIDEGPRYVGRTGSGTPLHGSDRVRDPATLVGQGQEYGLVQVFKQNSHHDLSHGSNKGGYEVGGLMSCWRPETSLHRDHPQLLTSMNYEHDGV